MKNKQAYSDYFRTSFDIKDISTRVISIKKFDEKKGEDTEEEEEFFTFEGYAATFGNIDFTNDIIEKGAFVQSLKDRTPKLLDQHNSFEFPIGVIDEIDEDARGLFIKASLPMADDRVSKRIAPQMKIGSIDSMSIGFRPIVEERNEKTGARTLKEIDLFEISLVTFPANEKAIVTGVKSEFGIDDVENIKSKKDFEDLLKSAGAFSRKACTYLSSNFINIQSESGITNKDQKQSESVKSQSDLDELLGSMKNLTNKMRS